MAQHKKDGACQRLIVTGCLAERYRDELQAEIPEIDAVLGTGEVPGDRRARSAARGGTGGASPLDVLPSRTRHPAQLPALSTRPAPGTRHPARRSRPTSTTPTRRACFATPRHYAYVKIAEGCDYTCAFCIIPTLRGALPQPAGRLDRPRGARARRARREGTAAHLAGHDLLRHRPQRARRARPPAARAERRSTASSGSACSTSIRRRSTTTTLGGDGGVREGLQVHRPAAAARVEPGAEAHEAARHAAARTTRCSRRIRARVPGVALRTTFIVGFPGETEADVDELCAFVARPRASTTSASSPTRTRKARRPTRWTTTCRRRTKTRAPQPRHGLQKRLVTAPAARRGSASGPACWSTARRRTTSWSCRAGCRRQAPDIDASRLSDRVRPVRLSARATSSRSRSSAPRDYDLIARPVEPVL